MRDQILNIVRGLWANAEIVLHHSAGAWLIEVLSPRINSDDLTLDYERFSDAFAQWNEGCPRNEIIIFHRVYLYQASGDQFKVRGTLHTIKSNFGRDGIFTTTLSANDAFMGLAEVDVQAHLYGANRPVSFRGVTIPAGDGSFDINEAVPYEEIEFEGVNCRIENLRRRFPGSDIWLFDVFD